MMYNNKFVACVKANGKVLREDKETVFLPFGSEYSLLLKNLNSVRALLSIEIDGTNVLDGEKLVVDANREVDLQRFMKKGNKDQGNRFKFIERTTAIENGPRGIGSVDGIVRISFQFEKRKALPVPEKTIIEHHHHYDYWGPRYFYRSPLIGDSMLFGSVTANAAQTYDGDTYAGDISNLLVGSASAASESKTKDQLSATSTVSGSPSRTLRSMNASMQSAQLSAASSPSMETAIPKNDVGITVAGSISDQKFTTVDDFEVETEVHVITLVLKGKTEQAPVTKPITVQTKLKCETCGTVNKSNAKFCRECGTALHIV